EWILLRRDPWLMSQTLMQMLYLLPPALMLWRSFEQGSGALQLLVPVLVMAAGQLAGGLAWLAISGEDAPDLVATAPMPAGFVLRAKIEAVLGAVAVIFAPLLIALAIASPWHALVAGCGIAVAAAAATAVQFWFRGRARRSQFRRRQVSSRLATFAEAFSSIGWAATAAVAAVSLWLAIAPAARQPRRGNPECDLTTAPARARAMRADTLPAEPRNEATARLGLAERQAHCRRVQCLPRSLVRRQGARHQPDGQSAAGRCARHHGDLLGRVRRRGRHPSADGRFRAARRQGERDDECGHRRARARDRQGDRGEWPRGAVALLCHGRNSGAPFRRGRAQEYRALHHAPGKSRRPKDRRLAVAARHLKTV